MSLHPQQHKILKKYFYQNRGFTMIEMLVSVGIIALLSAIFLTNYHGANYRSQLNMEAQKAVSNLNLARSFSLSSKKYNNSMSIGGWGVYFATSSPNSYLIFADVCTPIDTCTPNRQYDSGEADIAKGGRIINLPDKVVIDSTYSGNAVNIVFLPPDPIVYIDGATSLSAWIKFKETGNNTIKTITINSLGLSDISDN